MGDNRFTRFLDWLDDTGLSIVPAVITIIGWPTFMILVLSGWRR
jgi:hypothetical protein